MHPSRVQLGALFAAGMLANASCEPAGDAPQQHPDETRASRTDGRSFNERFPVRFVEFPDVPNARLIVAPETLYYLQPLQGTTWRTAEEAAYMKPDDLIFGLYLDGSAFAMPWWVIKNHHVANLVMGDRPVVMTFCEVCSGSAAFVPVVDGVPQRFRVAGAYLGTHFIADDESRSFWLPFKGEAFWGPRRGARLEPLPVRHCTWDRWLRMHPDSLVADGEGEPRDQHGSNWRVGGKGIFKGFAPTLTQPVDARLPESALVIGVEAGERSRAYPLTVLDARAPLVNDRLGQEEILILHESGTLLTTVFSRRLGGDLLRFEVGADGAVRDAQSGSIWNWEGEATSGPLAGRKLAPTPAVLEEWYSWSASHPRAEVFAATPDGPSTAQESAPQS